MTAISRYTRTIVLPAIIAAIVSFLVAMSPAEAQTSATWTGGDGNGTWSNASNWSTLPTTAGTWNLFFGGTTQTTSTNNIGTINLSGLSFTNDGSDGQTATFTLSGSTLALSNATITTTATSGVNALTGSQDSIGNALSLSGSTQFSLGVGHSLAVTGGMSGTGSVVVNGSNDSGWLYLSGSNSYTGGTIVNSGVVQNGGRIDLTGFSDTAFGTGNIVVSGSGTVTVRNNSTTANNFTVSGSGATRSGVGQGAIRGSFGTSGQTATISGTVTLSGDATITTKASAGVTGSKLLLSGPVNLGANVLTFSPGVTWTDLLPVPIEVSGQVTGSGSVVVNGESQSSVLLSASNSYLGGTTVSAGTLRVGNSFALGLGDVAVNAGVLDLNGQSLVVAALSGSNGGLITTTVSGSASLSTNSSVNSTYGGSITDGSGVVRLIKSGVGGLYLTGSSSYSGGTYVTDGLVQNGLQSSLTDSSDSAFGTGDIVVSGSGTVVVRNNSTLANNFFIGGFGLRSVGPSQGAIRGSFGTSGQTATISGTVTLSGDATITTKASAGVTGSKLLLSGPVNLGANVLTFSPGVTWTDLLPVPIEVSGQVTGSGSVVVNGDPQSGVLLSGSNSYAGGTQVNAGTLWVGSSYAVGTGALQVNSGGILDVNGYSLHASSLELNDGSTTLMDISGTATGLYAQVIEASAVTFGGALDIEFKQGGFAVGDFWQLFGGASYSGQFTSISATGAYGNLSFSYQGGGEWKATGGGLGAGQSLSFYENDSHAYNGMFKAGQLVIVPEPSSLMIAGVGVFVATLCACKRRREMRRRSLRSECSDSLVA